MYPSTSPSPGVLMQRTATFPWSLSHSLTPVHPMLRPTARRAAEHSFSALPGGEWDPVHNPRGPNVFQNPKLFGFQKVNIVHIACKTPVGSGVVLSSQMYQYFCTNFHTSGDKGDKELQVNSGQVVLPNGFFKNVQFSVILPFGIIDKGCWVCLAPPFSSFVA